MNEQIAKDAVQAVPEAPQGEVSANSGAPVVAAAVAEVVPVAKPADPADAVWP